MAAIPVEFVGESAGVWLFRATVGGRDVLCEVREEDAYAQSDACWWLVRGNHDAARDTAMNWAELRARELAMRTMAGEARTD